MNGELLDFYEFIKSNHPGIGGCMICKCSLINESGVLNISWLCIEMYKTSNGNNYTINEKLWYDYLDLWVKCNKNWCVVFRSL